MPLTFETKVMMSATFSPVIVVGTYVTLRMIQYLQCDRVRKTDIDELVLFEQGGSTDDMVALHIKAGSRLRDQALLAMAS